MSYDSPLDPALDYETPRTITDDGPTPDAPDAPDDAPDGRDGALMPLRWSRALWRPVSYAGQAGAMSAYLGWVLHVTVMNGSPWAVFEHAHSPHRRFSHFWFAKDGHVEQYAEPPRASWAQVAGNPTYISCETEGFPDEPLTDRQLDALAEFHVWSGMPDAIASHPGDRGIGTHYMGGAAWGGHTCPDPTPGAGPRSHQRAEIIRRAQALRHPHPTPPPPPHPGPTPPPAPHPAFVLHRVLEVTSPLMTGDGHGGDVAAVQRLVGMNVADQDDEYGHQTESHVRGWQAGKHITADGKFGPQSAHAAGWGYAG